ncbi:hypothetical protein EC991_008136 [Linnemannia zychae]|nr:hypothetical protein EC991_008136 [Linnemannia zychae]
MADTTIARFLICPEEMATSTQQARFGRAKHITDLTAALGKEDIAILFLEWQDETHCQFAVRNMTSQYALFSVRYYDRNNRERTLKPRMVKAKMETSKQHLCYAAL